MSDKTDYRQATLDIIAKSNPQAMNAAVPGIMIGTANLGAGILGAVDKRKPKVIMVNEQLADPKVNIGIKHTIPHEFEHILQNAVSGRYGKSYDMAVVDEYAKLGGNADKLVDKLVNSAGSSKLRSHLESIVGTPVATYFGRMSRAGDFSLQEQFAELSAIEAVAKKDLTKDPVVRKEFFGDDQALIDTYKATTGYRTTRMDARDLPPMTATATPAQPTVSNSVLDIISSGIRKALK